MESSALVIVPLGQRDADGKDLPSMASLSLVSEVVSAIDCSKTGKVCEKKAEKKEKAEKPPSPWKVEDFLKNETWFRDVIGLPATGEIVSEYPVDPKDMDAFFGKKVLGGYPFKQLKGSLLSQIQRDEICHFKLFTDGQANVTNDVLLVNFAKGYFMMRKLGLKVNWARFAAAKHKGQLDQQIQSRRPEPTPGTGIRDPSKKFFPFGVSSSDELPSPTLGDLIPPVTTSASREQNNTSSSVEQICTLGTQQSASQPHFSAPTLVPLGTLRNVEGNFQLLDHYIKVIQEQSDRIGHLADVASSSYKEVVRKMEESPKLIEAAMGKESSDRKAYRHYSNLKTICEKELAEMLDQFVTKDEALDAKWMLANDAKADAAEDLEDGLECPYVDECVKDFEDSQAEIQSLQMKIDSKKSALNDLQLSVDEAKNGEARAKADLKDLLAEGEYLANDVEKIGDEMQRLKKGHYHLCSKLSKFNSLKSSLQKNTAEYLTPTMIPSPIKCVYPAFRITNCPVCEMGYGYGNFLPASCGHAYHPACGLAYFQSEVEPRCKACQTLLHPSWLRSWGLPLGPANLEMEAHLGLDIHKELLLSADVTVRKDPEAYDELEYWNHKQRENVFRKYSATLDRHTRRSAGVTSHEGGNRREIEMNGIDVVVLKEVYKHRRRGPLPGVEVLAPPENDNGNAEIKGNTALPTLLEPKVELSKGPSRGNTSIAVDSVDLVDISTPPKVIGVPAEPPITRSQAGTNSKKRKGQELQNPRVTSRPNSSVVPPTKLPVNRHVDLVMRTKPNTGHGGLKKH